MAWKDGKQWVYSITYDEGCQALLEHALPLHREYGIPGHVALVASQVGVLRDVPGSSFDGWMILSREELVMLSGEGWGISCHSMTHANTSAENADYEVAQARVVLEQATGLPVRLYCVPGCNANYPAALEVAAHAGYTAVMTITDMVNVPAGMHRLQPSAPQPEECPAGPSQAGVLHLGRVPLHTEYPPPFYSRFDPYKRLHQAMDLGGWIIDYCHCPLPGRTVHPWKDCTAEQLEERLATVRRVGGEDVWLAEPNEVVEYLLGAQTGSEG